MSKQMENARKLYLRGIRDGAIEEVQDHYMGATYTQHSTGVPEGKDGFARFFEDFFARNPKREIEIVRALEDDNLVFLHVYQKLNGGSAQWVTADIFRSDEEGRIVEHWDVIDAYPEQPGEIDPIFGSGVSQSPGSGEDNKQLVHQFLTDAMQSHDYGRLSDYVDAGLIQHNQAIGQGSHAYLHYLQEQRVSYDFVFKLMGQGSLVVTYSKATVAGTAYALFDIFRLDGGRIVEHWDNKEPLPPRDELVNSGKF